MKAIIVHATGDLRYEEIAKPVPGPHEVVARVVCCGICGTDAEIFHGDTSLTRDGLVKCPVRIGHEWSGIVESVGSEVGGFQPGDRVISDTGSSCGHCEACLSGNFKKCALISSLGTVGDHKAGAFAEYIVMYDWHMHKIPDDIGFEEATLAEPGTIALNALIDCGVGEGTTVVITGTGAIGLMAVSFAKQLGAKVILAGRKRMKLDIGREMGAAEIIDLTEEDLVKGVLKYTGGRGTDVFYETTGYSRFITQALEATAYMGTIGLVGFYEKSLDNFDANRLVMEHKRVQGCEGSAWRAQQVLDMMSLGKISLKPMITHRIPFEEAGNAIKTARENTAEKIKTIVSINS